MYLKHNNKLNLCLIYVVPAFIFRKDTVKFCLRTPSWRIQQCPEIAHCTFRQGNSAMSRDSTLYLWTALSIKRFPLSSGLSLQVSLLLVGITWPSGTKQNRPKSSSKWQPFRYLEKIIMTLQSLLFSRLNNPSFFSLLKYSRTSRAFTLL